jgi:hypothetical protein
MSYVEPSRSHYLGSDLAERLTSKNLAREDKSLDIMEVKKNGDRS